MDIPLISGDNIEFLCFAKLAVVVASFGGLPLGLGTKSTGEVAVALVEKEIGAGWKSYVQ